MKTVRIIPRLDIKGPNLVKGIHFEGLRVLGNPNDYANEYYNSFADELMYVDVVGYFTYVCKHKKDTERKNIQNGG